MAASICRRTCSCRTKPAPPQHPTKRLPHRRWRRCQRRNATQLPTDLPNPLPPGAHRVISTLAAAEMRKMMEGVVLFGTGKPAQLNGYSSGGKTGTAQKIDPVTHTYSKTMHIASFAGFAPVNNPVIAVAVVIDSPKGAYYGAEVSAPVFAEVAQQVLEYLGVPHDIDLRPADHGLKERRYPSLKTTARPRAKTFRPSTMPPTICPATIRCAPRRSASTSSPAAQRIRSSSQYRGRFQSWSFACARLRYARAATRTATQINPAARCQCGRHRRRRATSRPFPHRPARAQGD